MATARESGHRIIRASLLACVLLVTGPMLGTATTAAGSRAGDTQVAGFDAAAGALEPVELQYLKEHGLQVPGGVAAAASASAAGSVLAHQGSRKLLIPPCTPQPEICDGLDNDCNSLIDEGLNITIWCGLGVCARELLICDNGIPRRCDPIPYDSPEVCDGLDNDCNGVTDDGLGNVTCGIGACFNSVYSCVNGTNATCTPLPAAAFEICDGLDNDCDGFVDEGFGTIYCGTGQCATSSPACVGGVPQTCTPLSPSPEVCDGIDNNCNGVVDDPYSLTCGVGACAVTVPACVNGTNNTCTPGTPGVEICWNGIDDDCDGFVDEACPPLAPPLLSTCTAIKYSSVRETLTCVISCAVCSTVKVPHDGTAPSLTRQQYESCVTYLTRCSKLG